jgi:hypothetical protein
MSFLHFFEIDSSERRDNFLAVGVVILYCIAYAAIRLSISQSMELDCG